MPRPDRFVFDAIGTTWQIDSDDPIEPELRARLGEVCEAFDATWSRFRPDSTVSRLRDSGGTATMPPESTGLAALYRALYELSDGAITPLIGRPLEVLGYDPGYRLTPSGPATPAQAWDDALHWRGQELSLRRGEVLDIGAAGKGALVDALHTMLLDEGHQHITVDGSGDLRTHGRAAKPLRIALAQPGRPDLAIGVAELGAGALCASATDRRRWSAELHHVLDGRTGAPVNEVAATWVVAETATTADALATGLFLAPAAALRTICPFEYVTLFINGQTESSAGFPGKVFV